VIVFKTYSFLFGTCFFFLPHAEICPLCLTALLPIHLLLSDFVALLRLASVLVKRRLDGQNICVWSMRTWISVHFKVRILSSTFHIMVLLYCQLSITLVVLLVFHLRQWAPTMHIPEVTSKWKTLHMIMPPKTTFNPILIYDLPHRVVLKVATTMNTTLYLVVSFYSISIIYCPH
jgi:hypothetical protein